MTPGSTGSGTYPASPIYSEGSFDADSDGNLESAWYQGGGGTMSVVNATPNVTPGLLRKDMAASGSSSWTTYFTSDANPITLVNAGDKMTITWTFSLTGVSTSSSTTGGWRLAVVDSPNASRLTSDASPGSSTYSGYALWMNMATSLGSADPFQLRERAAPATSSAMLSAAASWTSIIDQEAASTGYADGVTYTFTFTAERTAAAALQINASMTGGSVGGDGSLNVSFLDTSPNGGSFSFDTFTLRPGQASDAATRFDTSLFRVDLLHSAPIPEGSAFALMGLVGALTLGVNQFRRRWLVK